jgi:predicted XRE-type DNA-binding protein
LDKAQHGHEASDWKLIRPSANVFERSAFATWAVSSASCTWRSSPMVVVLHCFQKKSRHTSDKEIRVVRARFKELGGINMSQGQEFASVWDAIEDTPQQAASMRARAVLMMELEKVIRSRGMTQGETAKLFGVTQPRISDLIRGKINLFSLDALMDMAATAGLSPRVIVEHKGQAA